MKRKIFTTKTAVYVMLFLFLGSVVGGAIEYSIGRESPKLPESTIVRTSLTQGQAYAILSGGYLLLKYSVPNSCDFFCKAEVSKIEAVVQKYAPYVFLEETNEGTKMKMDAITSYGERSVENINATSVEDTICIAIPIHPECRRMRALGALRTTGENGSANGSAGIPNVSVGG